MITARWAHLLRPALNTYFPDWAVVLSNCSFVGDGKTSAKPSSSPTEVPNSIAEKKTYISFHDTFGSSPSTQFHSGRGTRESTRLVIQTSPPFCQRESVLFANVCRH